MVGCMITGLWVLGLYEAPRQRQGKTLALIGQRICIALTDQTAYAKPAMPKALKVEAAPTHRYQTTAPEMVRLALRLTQTRQAARLDSPSGGEPPRFCRMLFCLI